MAVTSHLHAEDMVNHDLFTNNQVLKFESLEQLSEYIKKNKPSTYRYFERLAIPARKRVFHQHQADQQLDITEMVLQEYRNRPRG